MSEDTVREGFCEKYNLDIHPNSLRPEGWYHIDQFYPNGGKQLKVHCHPLYPESVDERIMDAQTAELENMLGIKERPATWKRPTRSTSSQKIVGAIIFLSVSAVGLSPCIGLGYMIKKRADEQSNHAQILVESLRQQIPSSQMQILPTSFHPKIPRHVFSTLQKFRPDISSKVGITFETLKSNDSLYFDLAAKWYNERLSFYSTQTDRPNTRALPADCALAALFYDPETIATAQLEALRCRQIMFQVSDRFSEPIENDLLLEVFENLRKKVEAAKEKGDFEEAKRIEDEFRSRCLGINPTLPYFTDREHVSNGGLWINNLPDPEPIRYALGMARLGGNQNE